MALFNHMTQKAKSKVNQQTQTTESSLRSCKFYLIKSETVAVRFWYQSLSQGNYLGAILKHVFFYCTPEGYFSIF